jgi:phosphoglycolate phosphatase
MLTAFSGRVEFRPGFVPHPRISHIVFDFDGTLSLVRHGWAEIMLGMFQEFIPLRAEETISNRRQTLLDDILSLNGRQTIHQMIRLSERVRERGGQPREPQAYNAEFDHRLHQRISERCALIEGGSRPADDFLVHGARNILTQLQAQGFKLYLLSGTIERFVKREAALLGIAPFFGPHIYGGHEDHSKFSKQLVFERILREEGIAGDQLLSFGDGPVEIRNTRDLGGAAVAVASDEANNGSGNINLEKRQQLVDAGADAVIPDYRDGTPLMLALQGKAPLP